MPPLATPALPFPEGRDLSPRLVAQHPHGSKHEVLVASSIWTIFVCHMTMSGGEVRRISLLRTQMNKAWEEPRLCARLLLELGRGHRCPLS